MGEPSGLAHLLNPAPGQVRRYTINGRSLMAYEENGRLYHAWQRGTYLFPCDEQEREQYDLLHNLIHYKIMKHRGPPQVDSSGREVPTLLAKPIVDQTPPPYAILDVGCGSGIWAVDMSQRFPNAAVTGADIVGGQPEGSANLQWRTPDDGQNGTFDLESSKWGFTFNSFDLIHASCLLGAVSSWESFLAKVLRHLRPGTGQFELFEMDFEPRCDDGTLPQDCALMYWWREMQRAMQQKSMICPDVEALLHGAGFRDIQRHAIALPLNPWKPGFKEVAHVYASILASDVGYSPSILEGMTMAPFTRNLHQSRAKVDRLIKDVLSDVHNHNYHVYHTLYIWTARRPRPDESSPKRGHEPPQPQNIFHTPRSNI